MEEVEPETRKLNLMNSRWRNLLKGVTASLLKQALILTQLVWSVEHPNAYSKGSYSDYFLSVLEMMRYCPDFYGEPVKAFEQHLFNFFLVECSCFVMKKLLDLCGGCNDVFGNSLETGFFLPLMSLYVSDRDECRLRYGTYTYPRPHYYPQYRPCKKIWEVEPVPWDDWTEASTMRHRNFTHFCNTFLELPNNEDDLTLRRLDWELFRTVTDRYLQQDFYHLVGTEFGMPAQEVRVLMNETLALEVTQKWKQVGDNVDDLRAAWDRTQATIAEQQKESVEEAEQQKKEALHNSFKAWLDECRLPSGGNAKDAVPLKWVDFKETVKKQFNLDDGGLDDMMQAFDLRHDLKKLNASHKRKRCDESSVIRAVFQGEAAVMFRDDKKMKWSL